MPRASQTAITHPPGPAPLPLPPDLRDWFSDENNASQLRQLLRNPVLAKALSVLLERARPTQAGALTSAAQGTSQAALGYCAGYADAIRDLRYALTDPTKSNRLNPPGGPAAVPGEALAADEPWGYVTPDQPPI